MDGTKNHAIHCDFSSYRSRRRWNELKLKPYKFVQAFIPTRHKGYFNPENKSIGNGIIILFNSYFQNNCILSLLEKKEKHMFQS